MANSQKVSLSYTKILALGPGQVGKSTFLYRLMGLMKGNIQTADEETQPQSSTGAAELREGYISYSSKTGALTSDNWQIFDEGSDLQCQLEGLMSLLVEQTNLKKRNISEYSKIEHPPSTAKPISSDTSDTKSSTLKRKKLQQGKDETDFNQHQEAFSQQEKHHEKKSMLQTTTQIVTSQSSLRAPPQVSNIDRTVTEFECIRAACKVATTKTKFQMLLNVADIGGQPAFLEMLPSLTVGPALYLVFLKLLDGLTTRYPVVFKCQDGRGSKLCKNYTYTTEEVIFTALSSIACFGNSDEEVEQYVASTTNEKQTSSLALLVGTFRDKIDKKLLDKTEDELKEKLELTDFYKDGLIRSKSVLQVNNYSAPESEIEEHRKYLKDILETKFRKFEIPTQWLSLSISLKLLARVEGRHEVSFDDCVKLGSRFGMKKEMVKVALQFLHKYIGLVMYYPQNSHLKNVVVCDPQIVFSSISELIFEIYDPYKGYITEAQYDHFVRTGCFSPQEIHHKVDSAKKLLPIETVVHLLEHLNIIAKIPSTLGVQKDADQTENKSVTAKAKDASTVHKEYYFFPAVLQTADLSPVTKPGPNEEQLPEPLCIRFQTGYLPLGFVCALTANLIAEKSFELIPFVEDGHKVTYKNKIRFRFQGKFDIIMTSHSKYCEFYVKRCSPMEESIEFWDHECCPHIRTIICEAANRVIQSMQHGSLYKLSKGYELAFKCPQHPNTDIAIGHEPLAKLVFKDSSKISATPNQPKEILCVVSTCKIRTALSPEMKMWYGEVRLGTSCNLMSLLELQALLALLVTLYFSTNLSCFLILGPLYCST